jgi:hypothetical protein
MLLTTKRVVFKTDCHGRNCACGTVADDAAVPENLRAFSVDVLDPEDGQGVYYLAETARLSTLNEAALTTISEGEAARAVKARLNDTELAALGLTRD